MEIIKKHLDRREWYTGSERTFSCRYQKDDFFEGAIGLITFTGLQKPTVVSGSGGALCIADKGYQWLELAPKDRRHVVTAMFKADKLFQIYVDITLENSVFASGDAEFDDLFLDIVINEDALSILDRNELDAALDAGIISKKDYYIAVQEAESFIAFYNTEKSTIKAKLFEYRDLIAAAKSV